MIFLPHGLVIDVLSDLKHEKTASPLTQNLRRVLEGEFLMSRFHQ